MVWEDNITCATLPTKHPNCLKAMLAATKTGKPRNVKADNNKPTRYNTFDMPALTFYEGLQKLKAMDSAMGQKEDRFTKFLTARINSKTKEQDEAVLANYADLMEYFKNSEGFQYIAKIEDFLPGKDYLPPKPTPGVTTDYAALKELGTKNYLFGREVYERREEVKNNGSSPFRKFVLVNLGSNELEKLPVYIGIFDIMGAGHVYDPELHQAQRIIINNTIKSLENRIKLGGGCMVVANDYRKNWQAIPI